MQRLPSVIVPLALATLAMVGLTYCAAPRQYERGTPASPAPAQTRPGVGLPRYDPHAKPLPPQPQPRPKRYLPPEPDGKPGIWASDEPPEATPEPKLLGSVLPFADLGPQPERRLEIPRRCARIMQRAVDLWGYEHKLAEPRLKRCLAAELFRLCVNHHSDKNHPEYGAVHQAMTHFYDRACVGMEHSEELDNRFTGIHSKVDKALKEFGP